MVVQTKNNQLSLHNHSAAYIHSQACISRVCVASCVCSRTRILSYAHLHTRMSLRLNSHSHTRYDGWDHIMLVVRDPICTEKV